MSALSKWIHVCGNAPKSKEMENMMSLNNNLYEDKSAYIDLSYDHDFEVLDHKKQVRRLLEERLEFKRLKEQLHDELDEGFNLDDLYH